MCHFTKCNDNFSPFDDNMKKLQPIAAKHSTVAANKAAMPIVPHDNVYLITYVTFISNVITSTSGALQQ